MYVARVRDRKAIRVHKKYTSTMRIVQQKVCFIFAIFYVDQKRVLVE